ncbi:MAG: right-handed parallel beta-helix repeat-containing protein, partial [Candidatus Heimdallarchaeota archaeon]
MIRLFSLIVVILFIIPIIANGTEIIISDGDLIRTQGDVDVFIVKLIPAGEGQETKKFKRLVLNPEIFNKYDHLTWGMIKDVASGVVGEYETTDLVRSVDDDKVYKLYPSGDIGEKRWIETADDFLDLGYDWDAIYDINNFERDFYISGDKLNADIDPESGPDPEPLQPSDEGEGQAEEPTRDPVIINVPNDYSTIQEAIDTAIDGDTISVSSGAYNENLVIKKSINIIGSYAVSAIINGQGNGPASTIDGAGELLIQRFTIMSENEKGIYCYGDSLSKIIVKNTFIKDSGSGIYSEGNCDFTILNNIIFDNKDSSKEAGFGIFIKNSELYDFTVEILNNTIDSNYHGIWAENANLMTMNNIITNNLGLGTSSGIYHTGEGVVESAYNDVWQNGWNYRGNAKPGNGILITD